MVRLNVFSTFLTIVTILNVIQVGYMAIEGILHLNRYTYWNFLFQNAFYLSLWIGYLIKNTYLVDIVTLFLLPVAFGSAFFVFLYILFILLLDNGDLFIAATTIGGGHLNAGEVHMFDQLVHVFPVVELLLVLIAGYIEDARNRFSFYYYHPTVTKMERWAVTLYQFISPLALMGLYCIFFNPTKEYPTSSSVAIPISLGLACYFLIVWYLYAILKTKNFGQFFVS